IASLASDFVVTDLCFRVQFDGLLVHEILLAANSDFGVPCLSLTLIWFAHRLRHEWHSRAEISPFVITSWIVIVPHRVQWCISSLDMGPPIFSRARVRVLALP